MTDLLETDGWINHLQDCKQLSELDVKRLCDKVLRIRSPLLLSLLPCPSPSPLSPSQFFAPKKHGSIFES